MPLILKHANERFIYAREQAGLSLGQANKMLRDEINKRYPPPKQKVHWFHSCGTSPKLDIARIEAGPEHCGDNLYDAEIIDYLADIYGVSPCWLLFGRSEFSHLELVGRIPPMESQEDYQKLWTLYESMPRYKRTA